MLDKTIITRIPMIQPKKKNYLNNKDLLAAVMESKEQGRMTERLAHMLQTLTNRYGRRANFSGYTYNEDMQAFAMLMLVRTWNSFNPDKSNNPFAYFTQCIKSSFIQYLNQEKRQRDVRDAILVDGGMSPSYSYQDEHSGVREGREVVAVEDEEDFHEIVKISKQLDALVAQDDDIGGMDNKNNE